MRYLLAILLPPVAILTCGKPTQALLALILQITLIGWIPAAVWAILVVNSYHADKRTDKMIKAQRKETEKLIKAQKEQTRQASEK
jgi:uncharacterized membrane protein YqaE (UPF0057 family)